MGLPLLTSFQSSLQPSQAVALLNDRLKHVSKTNTDIADWLQVGGSSLDLPGTRLTSPKPRNDGALKMLTFKDCENWSESNRPMRTRSLGAYRLYQPQSMYY